MGGYWGCQLEGQIHSDSKDKKREDIKQAKYASGDNFVAYLVLRGLLFLTAIGPSEAPKTLPLLYSAGHLPSLPTGMVP